MNGLAALLKRAATFLGRLVEYALTGQTDFHVVTSELRDFDRVTDLGKGKRVLEEARQVLERDFQITVTAPVILELFKIEEASRFRPAAGSDAGLQVGPEPEIGDASRSAPARGNAPGARDCPHFAAVGWYRSHPLGEDETAHTVYAQQGLPRSRFKAIMAHELVHAWERENGVLIGERALREGFARWVEYKVLIREGDEAGARRLAQVRTWRFGRGIRTLLAIEKERGVAGVIEFVRSRK